ncbi:hypothetical protein RUM44_006999 [Polyplax serrata]|uniref:CRAL-TRIO domain-containing protein n=1 Tax=Polyplax serrata TaxID=468196 RepID=A0ABR1B138_POLSC
MLKSYEEFKRKYHDSWMTVDVPILKQLTLSGVVQVLPLRDQIQRRVFWLRVGLWKPSECSNDSMLQAGGLCGDATIVEPMTQVAGISIIFDFKDIGMSQVKALTPAFAKKMIYFLTGCLPVRVTALHVINEPSIFSMVFAVFKAFLTEKMKKKLYFHGSNMQSLHEHITPSCLPPELGGTAGEVDPEGWYKVLMGDVIQKGLQDLGYKFVNEDK